VVSTQVSERRRQSSLDRHQSGGWLKCVTGAGLAIVLGLAAGSGHATSTVLPKVVEQGGRHALIVDGAPFLMLSAQVNNSSSWPAMLPKVWPAVAQLHANTLEVPIAWQQIEPREGQFDFSFLDTLLAQARAQPVRLVLLWFGTWKNNGPGYAPEWVKLNNQRFPRVINAKGVRRDSLSPNFPATLAADRAAFVALMRHLQEMDAQHTVIMVQVENETGTYGAVRDFSPTAQKLFEAQVPQEITKALGQRPGTWAQVFGKNADEFFQAYSIAHFVDQVAAAGKAAYPIPMYVNAALRDPFRDQDPYEYSSGGPTWNVLDIWKAAAPSIDALAPDIYLQDYRGYTRTLELYGRADNALFVPETGNRQETARFFFEVMGRGGLGFSPFGMDFTGYVNFPLGAPKLDSETIEAFARNYKLVEPMMRELAALNLQGKIWGAAEPTETHLQHIVLGSGSNAPWQIEVSYGRELFGDGDPKGNPTPCGGILVAELEPNEYLVTGYHARVRFERAQQSHVPFMLARVEEGHYEQGKWIFERIWNGDQTDWGLNFTSLPQVLRVRLADY
jgi:beta-galactosidase GanA